MWGKQQRHWQQGQLCPSFFTCLQAEFSWISGLYLNQTKESGWGSPEIREQDVNLWLLVTGSQRNDIYHLSSIICLSVCLSVYLPTYLPTTVSVWTDHLWFFSSTTWVLGTELCLSGLVGNKCLNPLNHPAGFKNSYLLYNFIFISYNGFS